MAYVDESSFAENREAFHFASRGALLLAGVVVSWFSRIMQCVALRSTESEYVPLAGFTFEECF